MAESFEYWLFLVLNFVFSEGLAQDNMQRGREVRHNFFRSGDKFEGEHSQASRVSVQTCRVTYGGVNGDYYTSTRTTTAGTDGVSNFLRASCFIYCLSSESNAVILNKVVIEETKEADRTTGQAKHRVSRGIHDKVII
jgi:hypothetical protein